MCLGLDSKQRSRSSSSSTATTFNAEELVFISAFTSSCRFSSSVWYNTTQQNLACWIGASHCSALDPLKDYVLGKTTSTFLILRPSIIFKSILRRSFSKDVELTVKRYPALKRGNYATLQDADVKVFESILGGSNRVLTNQDDLVGECASIETYFSNLF